MSLAGSPNEEDKRKFRQLNSQLEEKVQSFRRLEEENELLQAEIERARAVPDLPHNLGDQLRDLRNAVEGLKADKRARDREADALQGDHTKLITDNVALVRKLDDAQKEKDRLAALKDNLEKKRREADAAEQDELERLRKELAEKEKEAKDTFDDIQQKNLKRLKEEKDKWEAKFKAEKDRLERDFQAATGAKDATINALENEIHKEKVEINNLLHSAAVVQGQIKDLEDEIAKLKKKIADNDHSTDPRAIQTKQDLEKKKKELEDQLGALKANIQNYDKEIDELTKANIAFRNEIQTYKNLLEGVSKKKSRPEPLPPLKLHAKLDEFHSQPSPQKLVPKLRGRIDITKVKKAANGDIEAWFHNTTGQSIAIDSWHIKVNNAFLSCTFLFNPNTVVPPGDAIVQIDPKAKGNLDESRLGPGTLIQLIDGSNTLVSQVEFAIANDSEGDQSCNTM